MIKTSGRILAGGLVAAAALASAPAHAGKTLDAIKSRGSVVCGVNTGLAGFSAADSQGNWTGLDVDVCRAIAAAVLGDGNKVKWVPLTAQQRFTALQSGEIDILSRNTTWTLTRDASLGMFFTGTTYYDGQGFMVPVKSKITSAKQLKGATVCVQSGTTTEKNLTDFSRANNLNLKPVVFEKLPGEQFWQVVEPERLWNFPTGQSVHGSEPVKLKLPGVQSCASAGDAFNVSAIAAIAAPLDNMARTLRVPFLAAFICSSPGSFGLRAPPL